MSRLTAIAVLLPLALAACAEERLTPAPGEAPGWPTQSPPRPSYAPLPFTTNYTPTSPARTLPAVPPGENVPHAVRGASASAPADPAAATANAIPAGAAPLCHAVPPALVDGKTVDAVCKQADGTWVYKSE